MSRRSDNKLRVAIAEIERLVFTDPDADTVLLQAQNQLMMLLNARFSYIYRCKRSDLDSTPWELLSCAEYTQDDLIQETQNSCASYQIPEVLRPVYLAGRCIISNDGKPVIEPLPHYHPEIRNYLCTPIADAKDIYAVLYLCNSDNGFDASVEARIRPLLAAVSCIVRASYRKHAQTSARQSLQHPQSVVPFSISSLIEAMFDSVIIIGAGDMIIRCNASATRLLDPDNRGLAGLSLNSIFPGGTPQISNRLVNGSGHTPDSKYGPENKHSTRQEQPGKHWVGIELRKLNNDRMLADIDSFKFTHGGQLLKGLIIGNTSEDYKHHADYHSILQRFQALTHMVPVGIIQLDKQWGCTYANDTFCEYCHMPPQELQGAGWLDSIHPDDMGNAIVHLRTKAILSGDYCGHFRLQSPLGRIVWVQVSASVLYDASGVLDGLILTFNDITQQLNNEKRLKDIADKDQLTGLTNRTLFNDRVNMAINGIDRFGKVALMFLDLDEFKSINDTYGHQIGDLLLKQVAQRLKMSVRKADTIARIGGDEFTLLLTNIEHIGTITAVANKLISAFSEPFSIEQHAIYMSCSIGIVLTEESHIELKTLLKQADIALYNAKASGRNQYKFYTHELDAGIDVYIQLKNSLKNPDNNDFYIAYQPQINALNGRIIGLEALTRWSGFEGATIGPDTFMKVIENSGLINDFSAWLFDSVFQQIQQWHDRLHEIAISINLSAKQLRNKALATIIKNKCDDYGLKPSSIILEMTETAIIEDPKLATATLQALSEAGFELSLDDFGTGYSSLAYLRNMPFQSVKIDKSFIQDVLDDDDDAEIVSTIISLAKRLRLKVIAEGVSSEPIKAWLVNNGCHLHQGFYFYKALTPDEISSLLRAGNPSQLNTTPQTTLQTTTEHHL